MNRAKNCVRIIAASSLAGMMALCLFLLAAHSQTAATRKNKPNIILILADDLGWGDLGCYGQKLIKTPNVDLLAREGTLFTQVYASAPVCAPSRASLMTGFHQGHAYIRGNNDRSGNRVSLRPGDTTIGDMLKAAGYRTGIIGKWGLGEPNTSGTPNKKGFDYFFGYLNQNLAHNYYPDFLYRNESLVELGGTQYSADLFGQEALDFISREKASPFFLYFSTTLPHANNELYRKTGNGMEIPSDVPYSTEKWTQPNKNYAAMVTKLDTQVGQMMALLKRLGIDRNTIVIFTSDNGPADTSEGGYDPRSFDSSGGLRGLKRELYDGGIREPMIVRWPRRVRSGAKSELVFSHYDLFPTFAEMAGTRPPETIDGTSVVNGLLGRHEAAREFLYWEFHEGGFVQAVRMKNWKGVRRGLKGRIELYDLNTDRAEKHDVSATHADIVRRITAILKHEHVESPLWPDETH